jgi:DNA-binding protein Fis
VLEMAENNQTKAAKILGIQRNLPFPLAKRIRYRNITKGENK